jgi:hypothetical protein
MKIKKRIGEKKKERIQIQKYKCPNLTVKWGEIIVLCSVGLEIDIIICNTSMRFIVSVWFFHLRRISCISKCS